MIDTATITALAITNILQGAFFVTGFYLVGKMVAKSVKDEIPKWIIQITKTLRENHRIEVALGGRSNV